jgi:hypothetical protein
MILPGTYANGFAPRDGEPLFPELWDGCTGAWAASLGNTGQFAYDWSPYHRRATLGNGAFVSPSFGIHSFNYDGVNDNLFVGTSAPRPALWTLSLWIRPLAHPGCDLMFSGAGPNAFFGLASLGGNIRVYESNGTSAIIFQPHAFNATNYPTGQWTHIAATADGSTLRYYRNGQEIGSGFSYTGGSTVAVQFYIGGGLLGSFNGSLDDARAYNYVMPVNHIRLLASRRGIAYQMPMRRWTQSQIAAYRARYYSQVIGSGVI